MALVNDYLAYTEKWKEEYGEKTLVLMQVGSFFEVYALIHPETGEMFGSNISEFSTINDMVISKKNVCVGKQQVVMAGFGLAQLEKYAKKLQDHGYTIVVYTQEVEGKVIKRKVSEIISPGTYFMQDGNSDELSNNTLCIWLHKSNKTKYAAAEMTVGISTIDIFTGKTSLFQYVIKYEKGPATYDELERYIAIYKPNECLLVGNITQQMLKEVVGFIGLECKVLHLISLYDGEISNENIKNIKNNTLLNKNALRAEKQIYQQEVFKRFYPNLSSEMLSDHFPSHFIASQAFCLLLDFIYQHSPNLVRRLAPPLFENHTDKLILANHSLRQLNILDDSRHTGKLRSVSSFLNNCVTSMGKRRFTYNLHNPTTNVKTLQESYNITDHILHSGKNDGETWETFRKQFAGLKDLEKLMRKIALHKVAPKDFSFLVQDLRVIAKVASDSSGDSTLDSYLFANGLLNSSLIVLRCNKLASTLESVFCLEKCAQLGEVSCDSLAGVEPELLGFLLPGTATKVDAHLKTSLDSREKLEAIRLYFSNLVSSLEKGKDGKAKTDFIKIHETPKSDAVLLGTSRRIELLKGQLLKKKSINQADITYYSAYSQHNETFTLSLSDLEFISASNKKDLLITNTQIKTIASDIQKSKDQLIQEIVLWYKAFLDSFSTYEEEMQQIIQYVCQVDLLQAKCYLAHKYNYCKPEISSQTASQAASPVSQKAYLNLTGLRHPLIEHLQTNELYVTNDLLIGQAQAQRAQAHQRGLLLYGTNAVGKTSFIKSVGIAVIMAQAGLYVPCSSFTYYPYSSLFTRILGNDNIFKGLSTFAVEMTELRTILTLTDENSLVLGDELCSGTESDSALSIFTAGLEVLHAKKCTFLFATHFHEIVNYVEIQDLPHLKMMHMEVKYNAETGLLIYDRKLKDGPGDSMYGLEVCKSLNLPSDFLERAHTIRMKYNPETKNILSTTSSHFNTKKIKGNCEICGKISSEVHHLQHQHLANKKNSYIDSFHKNHPANLVALCEECHQKIHKTDAQHKIVKTILGYKMLEI